MSEVSINYQRFRGIAFVGNYPPRKCGIATFTYDLAEAVGTQAGPGQPVMVCAMNELSEDYDYPDRVKFEIRQDYPVDYSRAADFLNFSHVDVVSLQHEYGIFGGEAGSSVLTLLRDLHRPLVVTCHTVLKNPKPAQKEVLREIAARASRLVVMSRRAFAFLEEIYGVDRDKIVHIPHGIHDVPFIDPSYFKDKFGLEGHRVLLTFGLLARNKGIEHMIEALPEIVERHPRTTYIVLGATHPEVIREEGESYRLSLQRRVRELGLEEHVLLHPMFVELDELIEYIGATDVYITPYLNLDQITSGTLAYAMGTGKAVVSTPYWHAQELLAEGRGKLVPPGKPKDLAREINTLLDDEVTLAAMRKRAYLHCRGMVWQAVARSYIGLFDETRSKAPRTVPVPTALSRPISAANLPTPKLDHLLRLSDSTGLAHHASRAVPDWSYGYWLDDAAIGLVVATKYYDTFGAEEAERLGVRLISLLRHLVIGDHDEPAEKLDYSRHRQGRASDVALGKAVWSLGYAVSHGPMVIRPTANDIFNNLVPEIATAQLRTQGHGKQRRRNPMTSAVLRKSSRAAEIFGVSSIPSLKGIAYATLGAADYLIRFPGASMVRKYLQKCAEALKTGCSDRGWRDRWDGADFAVTAQALAIASDALGVEEYCNQAADMVDELRKSTEDGTVFLRHGGNSDEEELPLAAASFIEAVGALYHRTSDRVLLDPIRNAMDWFLGANRRNESLYDFSTGGCYDAVTASGLNENQGTEATISYLLAMLTLHEIARSDLQTKIPAKKSTDIRKRKEK